MARLLFFGKLADSAGGRERSVELTGPTAISDIIARLSEAEPALGVDLGAPTVRLIVNEEMASPDQVIGDDDELAFLPPVSGG